MTEPRKFWVNASPRYDSGRYQRSTDRGLTISVLARKATEAVKNARATGFHKMGDYPRGTTFSFIAVEH